MALDLNEPQRHPDYLATRPRIRIADLQAAKARGEKWAMLTSYDATSARIFDQAKIPVLLVGDSAAQVVFGQKSTLPITMDELIPLAKAVASSCQRALVIADLPFGSYQASPESALQNATRFMKEAQVHGIKLEGGAKFAPHVELLTSAGIPVMGHVGLTPQAEHSLSGYKVQGRDQEAQERLLDDALKLQQAGAFACVVELVPSEAGDLLQSKLRIPVIGIGAGRGTDAQVLVWTDMVGFSPPKDTGATYLSTSCTSKESESSRTVAIGAEKSPPVEGQETAWPRLEPSRAPKFVKRYANISQIIYEAALRYADDVRRGRYPGDEHCY